MTADDFTSRSFMFVDIDANVDPKELARIAPGLQAQQQEDLAPEWGVGNGNTVGVTALTASAAVLAGYSQIQLHHDAPADEASALAIHTKDARGNPIAHAYVKLLEQYGVSLSSAVSHELCELEVDPDCERTATLPDGRIAALEICDQVEQTTYDKLGVEVSNFNTKANFGMGEGARYDFLGKQTRAFEVLAGGYAQVLTDRGWEQLVPDADEPGQATSGLRAYLAELDRRGLSRAHRRRRRHRDRMQQAQP